MSRWPDLDPEAIRALEPQAGGGPGRRDDPRAGRHRAGAGRAAASDGAARRSSCCPGRRASCSAMWRAAVADRGVPRGDRRARPSTASTMLRLFGIPESEIAETLRRAEAADRPRRAWRSRPACAAARSRSSRATSRRSTRSTTRFAALVPRAPRATRCSPTTGRRSTSRWRRCCARRRRTIATAESCTGGLLAGRLTELAGSSDYVLGGLVVYSNEAKVALAGVDRALIERVGAVSVEVAEALADGARARAGRRRRRRHHRHRRPGRRDRGQAGRARLLQRSPADGRGSRVALNLPGGRADVRDRSTTVAMHMSGGCLRGETAGLSCARAPVRRAGAPRRGPPRAGGLGRARRRRPTARCGSSREDGCT